MSRHWKEKFDRQIHEKYNFPHRGCRIVDLDREHFEWMYFVNVCSFTFAFFSLKQLRSYHQYFSQKPQPSSRTSLACSFREHETSVFDRLPMYLREEPKRQKTVKALEKALAEFSKESS